MTFLQALVVAIECGRDVLPSIYRMRAVVRLLAVSAQPSRQLTVAACIDRFIDT